MKENVYDIFDFLSDIHTKYSACKAISIASVVIDQLSAGNWQNIKNGLQNDQDFIELLRGKKMTLNDKENALLKEALEKHPESVSDVEAVDLLSVDVYNAAMQTTIDEKDKFEELSYQFARLRQLYKKILNNGGFVAA